MIEKVGDGDRRSGERERIRWAGMRFSGGGVVMVLAVPLSSISDWSRWWRFGLVEIGGAWVWAKFAFSAVLAC